jgi:hypothetical protein
MLNEDMKKNEKYKSSFEKKSARTTAQLRIAAHWASFRHT